MFGLDVTHQVIATEDIIERVGKIDNKIAVFVKELLIFFGETYKNHFGFNGGPIHDACTTMYLLKPELFKTEYLNVTVETKGEYSYGMTVIDTLSVTGREPNTNVAFGVDTEAFWRLFEEILKSFDGGQTDE